MRVLRSWAARFVTGVVIAGLLWTPTPSARAETAQCSHGDAAALFEQFITLRFNQPGEGLSPACQYRLFFDGQEFTFNEDDWFLGGVTATYDYRLAGVTRDEAIADLEKHENRLWLSEICPNGVIGPAVEQTLTETRYKDAMHPVLGHVVYRQDGLILHLPRGDYLSTFEGSYDGEVVAHSEVVLHILPSE
jgi:hypothetical protein